MRPSEQSIFESVEQAYLNRALEKVQSTNIVDRMEGEYIRDVYLPGLRFNMKYIDHIRKATSKEEADKLLSAFYATYSSYTALTLSMMVPPKHFEVTGMLLLKQIQESWIKIHEDMTKHEDMVNAMAKGL